MFKVISYVSELIASVSNLVAGVLIAFVAIAIFLQVMLRYVFNTGLSWPEEASRYGMIWMTLLIANTLVRDRALIKVDFFDKMWPERILRYRDITYKCLLLILLAVLTKEGFVQALLGWGKTTTALQWKWFWPYLAIPIGTGFMFLQMTIQIVEDIRREIREPGRDRT